MAERVRVLSEIEKVQNSMAVINLHRSTIDRATFDISILETLKVLLCCCFDVI